MNIRPRLGSVNPELIRNEAGQAKVRIGICFFMAAYFFVTDYTNHPLYLLFVAYCFVYLWITHWSKRFSMPRSFISILLDNFFTIAGLHVTGEHGTFLFIFLIQISIGNGLRFGRLHLWSSVFVACIGIMTLYFFSTAWKGNLHLALAYFLGTPFIAFYIDHLVKNLRKSKLEADKRADEISDLLAFVSHDIRTPLHALLTTAAVAKNSVQDSETRTRLVRIENTIKSLARLATDVLGATAGESRKIRGRRSVISSCGWVVDVSRRFCDELELNRINLKYRFDMTIWPAVGINLLAAERLLLNTLSNAIRFSSNGEIEISLNSFCHDESRCDLHICVTNRRGKSVPQPIPSPIDVSPHKSDDYYGTGLGLMVSKQLASSLGGEFSFHRISINEYVTDIRVPCERADSDDVKAILYPVVLVTQNEGLASRVREILASETNVIVINRITKLRSKIAALIIDEESLNDSLHSSRSDSGFLSEHLFSLIQSRETYRCEEISSLAFNSLAFDASDYEIINTVRTQSAARENETWFDPDLASNSVAGLSGVHFLVVDDNRVNREFGVAFRGRYSAWVSSSLLIIIFIV